ncbi:unnamed protein product [Orchesella dallaii]|uniref:Uncharacterized protein n=1 Tax=Orchesella dallaii TaxID=48710 RepID=A0ABP1R1F5_9HEXA
MSFWTRLLHMECWTCTYPTCKFVKKIDSSYHTSQDCITVCACRLVSMEWNNLISALFRAIFDVIRYPHAKKVQMQTESTFEVLRKVTNGLLTNYRSFALQQVQQVLELAEYANDTETSKCQDTPNWRPKVVSRLE